MGTTLIPRVMGPILYPSLIDDMITGPCDLIVLELSMLQLIMTIVFNLSNLFQVTYSIR